MCPARCELSICPGVRAFSLHPAGPGPARPSRPIPFTHPSHGSVRWTEQRSVQLDMQWSLCVCLSNHPCLRPSVCPAISGEGPTPIALVHVSGWTAQPVLNPPPPQAGEQGWRQMDTWTQVSTWIDRHVSRCPTGHQTVSSPKVSMCLCHCPAIHRAFHVSSWSCSHLCVRLSQLDMALLFFLCMSPFPPCPGELGALRGQSRWGECPAGHMDRGSCMYSSRAWGSLRGVPS